MVLAHLVSFFASDSKEILIARKTADVTFGEDASLIHTKNAPANFSIMRNIFMNVLKREKYEYFPQAIRMLGGKIKKLCNLLV